MERTKCVERRMRTAYGEVRGLLLEHSAQGTMEYAILVAVLVVVAIAAITAVGPMIGEMWGAIQTGMTNVSGAIV